MTEKRKNKSHYNEHRKNKVSFQVMMTPELSVGLEAVKGRRGIETNSELLKTLIAEELKRLKIK